MAYTAANQFLPGKGAIVTAGGVLKVTKASVAEKLGTEEVLRTGVGYSEHIIGHKSLTFTVTAVYDKANPPTIDVGAKVEASIALATGGKTWTCEDVTVTEASYEIDPKGGVTYDLTLLANGEYEITAPTP